MSKTVNQLLQQRDDLRIKYPADVRAQLLASEGLEPDDMLAHCRDVICYTRTQAEMFKVKWTEPVQTSPGVWAYI